MSNHQKITAAAIIILILTLLFVGICCESLTQTSEEHRRKILCSNGQEEICNCRVVCN